jgi:hypothetical protein
MAQDGPGTDQETGLGGGPGNWVTIADAARRLGVTPKAIRNRLERGTLEWRPAGNRGREVLIRPGMEPGDGIGDQPRDDPGDGPETVSLMVQVARLEERQAAIEMRAKAEVEALRGQIEVEIAARNAVIEQVREALAVERARGDRLEAALAEARRPWLAKVLDGLRRKG